MTTTAVEPAQAGRYLTADELARRWGRPAAWVRHEAKAGRIPAIRLGHRWRFRPADVAAYEERSKPAPAPGPDAHLTRDPLSMTPLSAARQRARRR